MTLLRKSMMQSSTEPPPSLKTLDSQGHGGIKSGRGFYDYSLDSSRAELDEAVRKRDTEFLNRLEALYRGKERVPLPLQG